MNNIFVLNKNYSKIGTLSNQGANPQAPYYEDLYVQELETGADTYQFSTISNKYTQDILEIGNHIMFAYRGRNELFTITSLEYSHNEGYKTIGVYAEGIGFELLEVFMERPANEKENSGGGNDSDNDGDDNTDDEYADPDDVYIDANGNIIYDKYGQSDYADPDNVNIDGNGNIIYRRSKNNRKNDSLEFKNISYPRFLSILLKNSGWTYSCQPGLESIKHNITVRYDRNIYAILQDSMQDYKGVELEFVHEYNNGKVQKIIKAYKDGGRGSFVGNRFEYGTNVRGITKTQKVANSEDDTVYFVDDVGIEVTYDIDFALKSSEVPEIEIGDTHYVIDNDFCPAMQIKARIGKIEISFSDPTVNKIYVANNKRVSGSAIEDEFGADDVADMLDDYDYGDSVGTNHNHNKILAYKYTPTDDPNVSTIGWASHGVFMDDKALRGFGSNNITLGKKEALWSLAYIRAIEGRDYIHSPRYFGYNYQVYYDRSRMEDIIKITDSSNITKQDLLNFVINDLNVYEYSSMELNEIMNQYVSDDNARFGHQNYLGLLSDDMFSHGSPCKVSKVGARIGKSLIEADTNNDGDQNTKDGHNSHVYNIPALLAALIGAFQHYVNGGRVTTTGPSPKDQNAGYDGYSETLPEDGYSGGGGYDPDNPGSGGDDPSNPGGGTITDGFDTVTGNELFVNKINAKAIEAVRVEVTDRLYAIDIVGTSISHMTTAEINAIKTGIIDVGVKAKIKEIEFPDGSTMTTANGTGGGTGGCIFEKVTTNEGNTFYYTDNSIYIQNDLEVSGTFYLRDNGEGNSANPGTLDCDNVITTKITFADGSTLTSANGLGSGGGTGGDNGGNTGGDTGSGGSGNTGTGGGNYPTSGWWDGTGVPGANQILGQYNIGGAINKTDAPSFSTSWDKYFNASPKNPLFSVNGETVLRSLHVVDGVVADTWPASDITLKENIRYIENTDTLTIDKENLETRKYKEEELLEKTDLYNFIINQVDICEYNFIGSNMQKIGFIANEYEGTKVGDKVVFRNPKTDLFSYDSNNLLFATIGALQEEVRTRDEQIANLEDRLARLEALLGNDN